MESVATLYETEAETYWRLSNDREFAAQVRAVIEQLGEAPQCVVEAFAGPAYHGACLRAAYPDVELLCVDTSAQMRDIACGYYAIPAHQYCVERIEEALVERVAPESLNLFLGLRFSLGHLEPADCEALMARLGSCLRPGGVAVFEIYSPVLLAAAMRQAPVATERRVAGPEGEIGVVCPAGELVWSETDWVVKAPWLITWYDSQGAVKRQGHYESTERLYTAGELLRMSQRVSSLQLEATLPGVRESFPHSHLVVLRKPRA